MEAISYDSHVLKLALNPAELYKTGIAPESPEGLCEAILNATELKRVGLKDASVFPGFCGKHDKDTFAPIEEGVLVFNEHQCFLATFRPACLELWAKRCQVNTTGRAKEDGIQSAFVDELGAVYVDNEVNQLSWKAALDAMLLSRDFSDLHWLVLKLDSNPGFATAGTFAPEVDFTDSLIQNINDTATPLQLVSYSVLPDDNGGFAIFGWHGESPAVKRFVEGLLLLGEHEWPDALTRVAFESIENTYFAESWWESLSDAQQAWTKRRACCGGMTTDPPSYKPDGVGFGGFTASVFSRR